MIRTFALALALLAACAVNARAQDVTKVVSADTIEVAGVGKVRLVGIDAKESPLRLGRSGPVRPPRSGPDTPPPPLITGSISMDRDSPSRTYLMKLVLGKRVRLEYDDAAAERGGTPRAYVYLEDGTLVNGEMLRTGNARVDTSRPFAQMDDFKELEREAQEARVGVWANMPER